MSSRREFCCTAFGMLAGGIFAEGAWAERWIGSTNAPIDFTEIERPRVLAAARRYLREQPITITASHSPRSAGGIHDYFSEGDYWWPDPANPGGPYLERDGESNPDNFNGHRRALIRLSVQMPALTAAWLLTRDRRFSTHAAAHLRAWFIAEPTRMNPHLEYAQAIRGRTTGRGIGIIDTVHLVEVARAAAVLEPAAALTPQEYQAIQLWFADYLKWMTTSEKGQQERETKNNHGTCWVVQVAEFAGLTANSQLTMECRDRFRNVLVPNQIAGDGSLPLELRRTKPYGYCLFNLDAMSMACQILSTAEVNLWKFTMPDGRGFSKALGFMTPYIHDKSSWPYQHDVQYWVDWPVRQPSLLFGGLALERPEWIRLWQKLNPDPTVDEIIRNFPYRQPLLWLGGPR